jgi:hypothetical protein
LLTYLVRAIDKQHPSALSVGHELSAVPAAAGFELEKARDSYLALSARYQNLKQKVDIPSELSRFAKALIGGMNAKFEEAAGLMSKAIKEVKLMLKDYGEDPRLMKSSDFFGAIATFLAQFTAAKLDEEKKKSEPPKAPVAGRPLVSPMAPFGDQQRGSWMICWRRSEADTSNKNRSTTGVNC